MTDLQYFQYAIPIALFVISVLSLDLLLDWDIEERENNGYLEIK